MRHATRQDMRHATRQDMRHRGRVGCLISCWRILVGQTQMSDGNVTPETRRALFRALVVAIASGEPEVTPRLIAAAVLRTAEVRSACDRAGVSTNKVATLVDGEPENAFARVLAAVEKS